MPIDLSTIRNYLERLTSSPEIADIYLALHQKGPQTFSELARSSQIERTKLYRLIEVVKQTGLIEVEQRHKRTILRASPPANLQMLLNQHEAKLQSLRSELPFIQQSLATSPAASETTRVEFYEGPAGIRQMQWNQTKSSTECLSIMHEPMTEVVGETFLYRWADKFNENHLNLRIIASLHFKKVNDAWYQQKKIPELMENVETRYIDDSIFKIAHNIDIWGEVTAHYNWKNGEIFGVEIYNSEVADSQRQFFELIWQQATKTP